VAEIRQVAKAQRQTVSEWVRQALRAARREYPAVAAESKIRVVRESLHQGYPRWFGDHADRQLIEPMGLTAPPAQPHREFPRCREKIFTDNPAPSHAQIDPLRPSTLAGAKTEGKWSHCDSSRQLGYS